MLLGAAFPNSSNFFLNYVIARAFMMNLFRLIMPRRCKVIYLLDTSCRINHSNSIAGFQGTAVILYC